MGNHTDEDNARFHAARAYCIAKFNYPESAYRTPEAREVHIDLDASGIATTVWFETIWRVAYLSGRERGKAEGIAEERKYLAELIAHAVVPVLGYVSRGRRFVDIEPYPDALARRALGALDEAGLLPNDQPITEGAPDAR